MGGMRRGVMVYTPKSLIFLLHSFKKQPGRSYLTWVDFSRTKSDDLLLKPKCNKLDN